MEPESQRLACELGGPQFAGAPITIAAVSIAISLKRIADALTYQESAPENLFDHIRAFRYATEQMENRR